MRIVVKKPPLGVAFALQKGRGSAFELVQTQISDSEDLQFVFAVAIKNRSEVNFAGPFVQGPKGGRFIYLSIGQYANQSNSEWAGRMKVPLSGITSDAIDKVLTRNDAVLETTVPGSTKDGKPAYATVKPFAGWNVGRKKA